MKQLTAKFVREVTVPGRYYDGDAGLFLLVKPSGRKSFVQRLTIHGKRHDIGLGSDRWVSLTEARATAQANRKLARMDGDPLAAKRSAAPTFADAVETVIGIHRAGWKDAGKSEKQWRASLRDYVMPRLGRKPVDRITTADVMAVLLPIWHEKHETARRVRQRISTTMKWAVAQGYRDDNPAGDAISAALPKNGKIKNHHRALPFAEVAGALDKVRESGAGRATVLAMEFLVLTACRSGEVRLARWDEVDVEAREWTVPAARMKAKRDHRVPLCGRAMAVLAEARELADGSGLLFPSPTGRPGASRRRPVGPSATTPCRSCCASSGSTPFPTGSVRASAIGPPSAQTLRARSASWRSRTSTRIGWKLHTAAATCSNAAAT